MPTPSEDLPRYATSSKVSSSSRSRSSPRTHKKTHPPRRRSKKTKAQKKAERLKRWRRHAQRLKTWLAVHGPKIGQRGKEIKSHVIDNDPAKMATSHGVIQGYNGQAVVDDQPQIIVVAEAFGAGQDAQNLTRIMPRAKTVIQRLGWGTQGFRDTTWLADSSSFSDGNLKPCDEEPLNAYIPDDLFRQRDPRVANQARYKPKKKKKTPRVGRDDCTHDEATDESRCPNGTLLRLKAREPRDYASDEQDCQGCPFRAKCLSKKTSKQKHLSIPVHEPVTKPKSRGQRMIEKIDSPEGTQQYRRRLALVEPVFATIRTQKHLDHLTLRGKDTVDIQWMLYAIVHNIEKLANYGELT